MPKPFHRLELRFALITAIALLLGQLGATAHAYSHGSAGHTSTHQSIPGSRDICNDCLGFAPLLSAAGLSITIPVIEAEGRSLARDTAGRSLIDRSTLLAFRSRAPPRTL